ncbi:hypothetical protein [Flavobacterium subsaxonicum]|uniref:hypothetical protein n=1 Tax=Flavobacterium subsaxonicum TaxID=426226 RepID=UPI0003FCF3E3|nr:hypothetical protein [Flavobacterium subsaxonicum]
MKQIKLIVAFVALLLLQSCIYGHGDDDPGIVNPGYGATVMTRTELENSIHLLDPQAVTKSGKIYIKDNYLFVNDVNRGFHIYNYSDPQHPSPMAYLEVPGATDLSMRGNTLYINQAVDLVTLTLDNNAIYMVKRNRNVFPQKTAPDNSSIPYDENAIIINWYPL